MLSITTLSKHFSDPYFGLCHPFDDFIGVHVTAYLVISVLWVYMFDFKHAFPSPSDIVYLLIWYDATVSYLLVRQPPGVPCQPNIVSVLVIKLLGKVLGCSFRALRNLRNSNVCHNLKPLPYEDCSQYHCNAVYCENDHAGFLHTLVELVCEYLYKVIIKIVFHLICFIVVEWLAPPLPLFC